MDVYLSEEEIQVLIALLELDMPVETPNNNHYSFYPKNMTEASHYFHHRVLPWDSAYRTLLEKHLIIHHDNGYGLTSQGGRQADILRRKRPPIYYWYQTFYHAISSSPTFARFCEDVYGINWEQHGFCDFRQIQFLLDQLSLCSQQTVLEIGCGTGRFTEYLADQFDVNATGIDYCDAAIQFALTRTHTKRDRLTFHTQDIHDISDSPQTFDAIIAIDSLGFVSDLGKSIHALHSLLKNNGRLAIFWFAITDNPHEEFKRPEADGTAMAEAFKTNGMSYVAYDMSEENWSLLQLKYATTLHYEDAFLAEGHQFLCENLLRESEKGTSSYCKETCHIRRFLYVTQK